jgi:hypothetical protein
VQRSEVGSLEGQLDHHDVSADVDLVQLAVHVRERPRVVLDLLGELVGAGPGDSNSLESSSIAGPASRSPRASVIAVLARILGAVHVRIIDGSRCCLLQSSLNHQVSDA